MFPISAKNKTPAVIRRITQAVRPATQPVTATPTAACVPGATPVRDDVTGSSRLLPPIKPPALNE